MYLSTPIHIIILEIGIDKFDAAICNDVFIKRRYQIYLYIDVPFSKAFSAQFTVQVL